MQARCDSRANRCRCAVLSAQPRVQRSTCAQPADPCLRRRDHRQDTCANFGRDPEQHDTGTHGRRALMKAERMNTEAFNVARIRADFPILGLQVSGKPLVYLDNAASSQMPQAVIDRIVRYQTQEHSNIHRAVHYLSELATREYEAARVKVQRFLKAKESREIIFTRGTTEAITLVMHGYGRALHGKGGELLRAAS